MIPIRIAFVPGMRLILKAFFCVVVFGEPCCLPPIIKSLKSHTKAGPKKMATITHVEGGERVRAKRRRLALLRRRTFAFRKTVLICVFPVFSACDSIGAWSKKWSIPMARMSEETHMSTYRVKMSDWEACMKDNTYWTPVNDAIDYARHEGRQAQTADRQHKGMRQELALELTESEDRGGIGVRHSNLPLQRLGSRQSCSAGGAVSSAVWMPQSIFN